MTQEITNFGRFYAAFNLLPYKGDREEIKRSIVLQYTGNRTDSLRQMTRVEYDACCAALERASGRTDALKAKRSSCLHLMQKLGVDTADWARVNNFCQHPKIAGKPFARITIQELEVLEVKLRSIQRKGGLKNHGVGEKREAPRQTVQYFVMGIPTGSC